MSAKSNGTGITSQEVDLPQYLQVVSIEMAPFHPMKAELKSEGRMREQQLSFFSVKEDVFVMYISCKVGNLNVQPHNLFLRAFEFEGLVNCKASGRCRPRFPLNILMGIMEEIKVQEEGILNDLIPVKYLLRWH